MGNLILPQTALVELPPAKLVLTPYRRTGKYPDTGPLLTFDLSIYTACLCRLCFCLCVVYTIGIRMYMYI